VQFDDGTTRDDIRLDDPAAPVSFDSIAYGSTVEVRFDGGGRRGRLVQLVMGSEVGGDRWGIRFEDGGWAEDVKLGDPESWWKERCWGKSDGGGNVREMV
jgi:hypothetical protein